MPLIPRCPVRGHDRVGRPSIGRGWGYEEARVGRPFRDDVSPPPPLAECPDCHPELRPQRDLAGARRVEAAWRVWLGLPVPAILQTPPWVCFEDVFAERPGVRER